MSDIETDTNSTTSESSQEEEMAQPARSYHLDTANARDAFFGRKIGLDSFRLWIIKAMNTDWTINTNKMALRTEFNGLLIEHSYELNERLPHPNNNPASRIVLLDGSDWSDFMVRYGTMMDERVGGNERLQNSTSIYAWHQNLRSAFVNLNRGIGSHNQASLDALLGWRV